MTKQWSIKDQAKGARTIEEITTMSKLGKRNPSRHNCSHKPLFPFVSYHRFSSYVSKNLRHFNKSVDP